MKTYYELLEVLPTASTEIIVAAHKAMTKKYHPDVCKLPNATQLMQEINQAKDVLVDSQKRAIYDLSIQKSQKQYSGTYYKSQPPTVEPDDLETLWIKYEGVHVQLKYFEVYNMLHINFYTKDNDVFHEIKDVVKYDYNFKWDNDIRFWKGPIRKGMDLLAELGVV